VAAGVGMAAVGLVVGMMVVDIVVGTFDLQMLSMRKQAINLSKDQSQKNDETYS
jgi:hypothetical protein